MMATHWGMAMLIANRSSPDPLHPAGFVVSLAAGVLLLRIGFAAPIRPRSEHLQVGDDTSNQGTPEPRP
jgi:hypothetical protein